MNPNVNAHWAHTNTTPHTLYALNETTTITDLNQLLYFNPDLYLDFTTTVGTSAKRDLNATTKTNSKHHHRRKHHHHNSPNFPPA